MHPYYSFMLYDTKNLHPMYLGDYKPVWSYAEYLNLCNKLADSDGA